MGFADISGGAVRQQFHLRFIGVFSRARHGARDARIGSAGSGYCGVNEGIISSEIVPRLAVLNSPASAANTAWKNTRKLNIPCGVLINGEKRL